MTVKNNFMTVTELWEILGKIKDKHPNADVVLGQHNDRRIFKELVHVRYDGLFDTVDLISNEDHKE